MKVYKYPLEKHGPQVVMIPRGARVVHVHEQNGEPTIWAELIPDAEPEMRQFWVVATGEDIPSGCRHLGTVHIDWVVLHVYEPALDAP